MEITWIYLLAAVVGAITSLQEEALIPGEPVYVARRLYPRSLILKIATPEQLLRKVYAELEYQESNGQITPATHQSRKANLQLLERTYARAIISEMSLLNYRSRELRIDEKYGTCENTTLTSCSIFPDIRTCPRSAMNRTRRSTLRKSTINEGIPIHSEQWFAGVGVCPPEEWKEFEFNCEWADWYHVYLSASFLKKTYILSFPECPKSLQDINFMTPCCLHNIFRVLAGPEPRPLTKEDFPGDRLSPDIVPHGHDFWDSPWTHTHPKKDHFFNWVNWVHNTTRHVDPNPSRRKRMEPQIDEVLDLAINVEAAPIQRRFLWILGNTLVAILRYGWGVLKANKFYALMGIANGALTIYNQVSLEQFKYRTRSDFQKLNERFDKLGAATYDVESQAVLVNQAISIAIESLRDDLVATITNQMTWEESVSHVRDILSVYTTRLLGDLRDLKHRELGGALIPPDIIINVLNLFTLSNDHTHFPFPSDYVLGNYEEGILWLGVNVPYGKVLIMGHLISAPETLTQDKTRTDAACYKGMSSVNWIQAVDSNEQRVNLGAVKLHSCVHYPGWWWCPPSSIRPIAEIPKRDYSVCFPFSMNTLIEDHNHGFPKNTYFRTKREVTNYNADQELMDILGHTQPVPPISTPNFDQAGKGLKASILKQQLRLEQLRELLEAEKDKNLRDAEQLAYHTTLIWVSIITSLSLFVLLVIILLFGYYLYTLKRVAIKKAQENLSMALMGNSNLA